MVYYLMLPNSHVYPAGNVIARMRKREKYRLSQEERCGYKFVYLFQTRSCHDARDADGEGGGYE